MHQGICCGSMPEGDKVVDKEFMRESNLLSSLESELLSSETQLNLLFLSTNTTERTTKLAG